MRALSAAVLLGALLSPPASAGVLVGTGTYLATDDLTRIQVGSNVLEFLSLTTTEGVSVADALTAHGGAGFRWATGSEVNELFDAFGFAYAVTVGPGPNNTTILGATPVQASLFVSYLGNTYAGVGTASVGWIDDPNATSTHHVYACIGDTCSPDQANPSTSFTNYTTDFWPVETPILDPLTGQPMPLDPSLGVFLVRDTNDVVVIQPAPEPASLALLGLGLAGLRWSQRKPKR